MAVFSFNGLASGLDTGSIVDELTRIRRRPLDLEIAKREDTQTRRDTFGTLETKLLAVKTALQNLRTPEDVRLRSASSSDTDVLSVTAGTGSANGVTTVSVTQLAGSSRATAANGLSATSATVASGTGTFQFTVGGGATQSVDLTASTTLQELADGINALGAGVTASAVNVGTPSAPSYKLQIVANSPGTTSDIAIVNDDTTLGVTAAAGQNAQFTVTGFTETIERASNTVSDVIPGVTFVLKQAGESADVTVTDDTDAVEANVQGFVDAFNDLVQFVAENSTVTRVDDEESEIGPLVGNPTVRGILEQLRANVRASIDGADGGVTTLSQIGIATQQDGTLEFDVSTFRSEYALNPQGVGELLGGVGLTEDGVADLLHNSITTLTQTGGLLDRVQEGIDDAIERADRAIELGERFIDAFRADLESTFAALEQTLSRITSQGDFLLAQLASTRAQAPSSRRN
jgi:flagellar hook-associated protein 2